MADTMAFALLGALVLTLTLVPVLASFWFKSGVKEKVNRPYEAIKRFYTGKLDWALDHPGWTMIIATLIFALSLLLVPFIGGEFMPHLDEGALWVRATMPYTISFDEASKLAPQMRDILMSYPQVTVVGSELGRPDDGTDPTGFFNCEFYVGLKPYDDKAWGQNGIHDKKELIESINKRLTAFPGIIFNYTQPAEDAVDEALTGLKSALAVKVYGPDLNVLQDKAVQIKNVLSRVPGFEELTVVRELGQPTLLIEVDREKIARYGINVSDVRGCDSGCSGRTGGHPGDPGREAVRPRRSHAAAVPQQSFTNWQSAGRYAGGTADSAAGTGEHQGEQRGIIYLSRKQFALYRRAVQH